MIRALVIFLLVLGVVVGGLLLLRRTAGTPTSRPRARPEAPEEENRDDW